MSCKAYLQWNGLRLGWASAEFLGINQYISNTAFQYFFVSDFLVPSVLWHHYERKYFGGDVQPPSEEWGSVMMQSSSRSVRFELKSCLFAWLLKAKGKLLISVNSLLSSSPSYPTTLLSLISAIQISVSMIRNCLTSLCSSFPFC